ncbi:MAG TPA: hypothetical protein PLF79_07180 [Thauera sp.]|uniref:hypothetical protein n=1 Tax=Thauera sp. TaxID=1905334 RepID=UPI002C45D7C9|nr:hypothetical protein [Thauera sp.]HRP25266.1 hypothetical protein [Thauera sp.]HRP65838.1 hypothetical protein [Thauera sp.]
MAFKLITFALILLGIAVLGMRGYRAAVHRFEREAGAGGSQQALNEAHCEEAKRERPPA